LTYKPTVLYKSNQNRIAEKTILYTKADTRAILAKAKLPIEFWDKTAKQIYIYRIDCLERKVYSPKPIFSFWKKYLQAKKGKSLLDISEYLAVNTIPILT
jgi:hypothetical protein